jgi:hypothetical protein
MTNLTETPDVSRIEALVTQGMHRIGDHEGPFSLHVLGLGKTGANVIESMVTAHRSGGVAADTETPFHPLAIDIGGDELTPIQEAAAATTSDRVRAQTVSLPDLERRGGARAGGVTSVKDLVYRSNGPIEPALRDIASAGYTGVDVVAVALARRN